MRQWWHWWNRCALHFGVQEILHLCHLDMSSSLNVSMQLWHLYDAQFLGQGNLQQLDINTNNVIIRLFPIRDLRCVRRRCLFVTFNIRPHSIWSEDGFAFPWPLRPWSASENANRFFGKLNVCHIECKIEFCTVSFLERRWEAHNLLESVQIYVSDIWDTTWITVTTCTDLCLHNA